ncbi:hypothetical protein AJ79_03196 [Helicocarpus griseus UAMH5409]|uniref:Alcohol acetyltransferase n=1 Tax=Helicocarpus griseus UAMH5409 TaxID=1447875 RepID=A0A2B7XZL6_9EURO|nr:hypothetical protein AJ79_03196 [Helicocarpus griseus UAMH5409]
MANINPSYANFVWQETRPGRWERDIDEAEQFYTTMAKVFEGSGRHFFAITGHISLSVDVPQGWSHEELSQRVEDALRKAWTKLRQEQPTIAAWVEYNVDEGKVSNGQTGVEWYNSDPPVHKLPTLYVITPPTNGKGKVCRDVVLRSPHDIIDGIGTLHLFDRLLTHASRIIAGGDSVPQFGSESANLGPPFRVAACIPPALTAEQELRKEEIAAAKAAYRSNVDIARVPFKKGTVVPGKHQRVARMLSEAGTKELLAACKEAGVTPTHVFHAAVAVALQDLQTQTPESRSVRYISYSLVDERSKFQEPFNTPKYAAGVYHSVSGKTLAVDLTIPAANDAGLQQRNEQFQKIVTQMKDFYYEVRNDKDNLPLAPSAWAASTPPYPVPGSDTSLPSVPAPNPTPSVSISSMGLVDRIISSRYGVLELYNPWVTGEELGTGLGVFLCAFRGQLSLSVAYNDAWHDEDEVGEFLAKCEEVVFRGFGLL